MLQPLPPLSFSFFLCPRSGCHAFRILAGGSLKMRSDPGKNLYGAIAYNWEKTLLYKEAYYVAIARYYV